MPAKKTQKEKKALIVDDDIPLCTEIQDKLGDRGITSIAAHNSQEALRILEKNKSQIRVAVIDQRLPGKPNDPDYEFLHGRGEGLRLARRIRESYPQVRLVGMSTFAEQEVREWFAEYGFGFLRKYWLTEGGSREFIDKIETAIRKPFQKRSPDTFIVHGHDNQSVHELTSFLTRSLGWQAPVVLREEPSGGRTLLEKFENAAQNVDVVFVLLTPDDIGSPVDAPDQEMRRARQNVIFELGYFYGKLQRTGGRIILLHKGNVELPSDLDGLLYIDFSAGVEAVGEQLRRELAIWL